MEVAVRGPWGSVLGHLGKGDDTSRPGPMDLVITQDALYLLDLVKAPVQVFDLDKDVRREIAIGTRTADCMGVNGDLDEDGDVDQVPEGTAGANANTWVSLGIWMKRAV